MAPAHREPGRRRLVEARKPSPWPRPSEPRSGSDPVASPLRALGWLYALGSLGGTAALVCAVVPMGPGWLGAAGAVAVTTSFTAALALRSGRRPVVAGAVALGLGLAAVFSPYLFLRGGAAVLVAVVASVLAVVATVPAPGFIQAMREVGIGFAIAAVGALAVLGYEPSLSVPRFEYLVPTAALLMALILGYRLGAGLHGLGRRGIAVVVAGGVLLLLVVVYAEALRRDWSPALVEAVSETARRVRSVAGGLPQPIPALFGFPALAWGCHLRARRRQGWWVCALGAGATSWVAVSLADRAVPLSESYLDAAYSLGLGLILGFLLIRADLLLTGPRLRGSMRRERAAALRPEPGRGRALL